MTTEATENVERDLRKLRITSAFLGVAFTILTIAVGVFIYWSFTGKDVIVLKQGAPLKVTPSVVQPGGKVIMSISFCKIVSARGRITRRLVSDTSEVFAPTEDDTSGKSCYDNAPVPVPIPEQTACGTYKINYRVVYKTNPLHTVVEEFESQSFKVCT